MNREERESQLSAMFDGELPAGECELLSRRLARDELLRTAWSRYAVIGAAMRSEPVAAVSGDFSHRVSAAIDSKSDRVHQPARLWRNVAVGASLAAGVAGAAVFMLRSNLLLQGDALVAYAPTVQRMALPQSVASVRVEATAAAGSDEPLSYVVPPSSGDHSQAVPAALANYVLAHSEYSSPLTRRNLISSLVGSDADESVPPAATDQPVDGQPAHDQPANGRR